MTEDLVARHRYFWARATFMKGMSGEKERSSSRQSCYNRIRLSKRTGDVFAEQYQNKSRIVLARILL